MISMAGVKETVMLTVFPANLSPTRTLVETKVPIGGDEVMGRAAAVEKPLTASMVSSC
jgi:hypothetical protein